MSEWRNVSPGKNWETATVVSTAGNLENDETVTTHDTLEAIDIDGVDRIVVRIKSFTLDSATSITIWPEVADAAGEYGYLTDLGNSPFPIPVAGTTRTSRVFPAFNVSGYTLRLPVGSIGTPGNELISIDVMRFKKVDTP